MGDRIIQESTFELMPNFSDRDVAVFIDCIVSFLSEVWDINDSYVQDDETEEFFAFIRTYIASDFKQGHRYLQHQIHAKKDVYLASMTIDNPGQYVSLSIFFDEKTLRPIRLWLTVDGEVYQNELEFPALVRPFLKNPDYYEETSAETPGENIICGISPIKATTVLGSAIGHMHRMYSAESLVKSNIESMIMHLDWRIGQEPAGPESDPMTNCINHQLEETIEQYRELLRRINRPLNFRNYTDERI